MVTQRVQILKASLPDSGAHKQTAKVIEWKVILQIKNKEYQRVSVPGSSLTEAKAGVWWGPRKGLEVIQASGPTALILAPAKSTDL